MGRFKNKRLDLRFLHSRIIGRFPQYDEFLKIPMKKLWSWRRLGGYEVSSKGDARFSAFNAILDDGRSIEIHYQCDIKGYDIGGTNWRLSKGQPSKNSSICLWGSYLGLWKTWAERNPELILDLYDLTYKEKILSDRFATTPVNQAHALCEILNEIQNQNYFSGFEIFS